MSLAERLIARARRPVAERLDRRREQRLVRRFHRLYFDAPGRTWKDTRWLGIRAYKNPLDLWIYQELVWSVRPEVIIETGTAWGGSALYLATICEAIGSGEVVTIDSAPRPDRPAHARVTYVDAPSTAPETLAAVAERVHGRAPVMVILDSDHRRDHVLDELHAYAGFVTPGSYLVVEDTNLNGHPVEPDFGPGPMEAVRAFLAQRDEFVVDDAQEKFFLTFNPGGFLRRKATE
jgi:cephalosporin hydroxylase